MFVEQGGSSWWVGTLILSSTVLGAWNSGWWGGMQWSGGGRRGNQWSGVVGEGSSGL